MKTRELNFELLRILAMLMVLGLHANFMVFKTPAPEDIMAAGALTRVFLQCACIVAVNVFVMISGWFGIKASMRGFCNFMWQVIYIVGLVWIVGVLFFNVPVNYKTILAIFGLYGGGGWFVASYIGLYIISPVLNRYIADTAPRKIALMLLAFFTFELLWGNTLSVEFVVGGYSTFSFIGIYILAGLLRKLSLKYSHRFWLFIFLLTVVCNSALCVIVIKAGIAPVAQPVLLNYISPLVITGAASLLLTFSKISISSRIPAVSRGILWLSASCFAAYLIHCGGGFYALKLYTDGVAYIADALPAGLEIIGVVGYIICVFLAAVLIDQPRRLIWNRVLLPLFNRKKVIHA